MIVGKWDPKRKRLILNHLTRLNIPSLVWDIVFHSNANSNPIELLNENESGYSNSSLLILFKKKKSMTKTSELQ